MRRSCTLAIAGLAVWCGSTALAVDLEFRQLNWLDDAGNVMIPFSRVGEVEFHFDVGNPDDMQFVHANGGGYINIVIQGYLPDPEWVVQNLYLVYCDPVFMMGSSPSVQFALPVENGDMMDWLEYEIYVTPEPFEPPMYPPTQGAPVPVVDYHAGGFAGGGSGLSDIPMIIGPWIGPFDFPIDAVSICIPVEGIAAIDEDTNGCAPASAARSIKYLGDTNGFATEPAQDIYEDLWDDMGTTADGGTTVDDMLEGKDEYTGNNNLPIDSEVVYGFGESIDDVMDAIENGADVEIFIGWDGGGGHAAMVTSIVKHADGSYTITYVDDPTQGDGQAENEEHTIHVNPDGSFDGGHVFGFMVETVAMPGDLNGDGVVDQSDLGELLSAYGLGDGGDCDGDGDTDQADLGILLANYGHTGGCGWW